MYLEKRVDCFLGVFKKKIEIPTFRRIFFIPFPSLPSRVCGLAAYIEIITHWFCFHAAVSVVPRLGGADISLNQICIGFRGKLLFHI